MPHLDHSLINPNQLRYNGVEVQDNPYAIKPMTITSKRDGVNGFSDYLDSTGTTIFLITWTPRQKDLELYPHIQLSSSEPWDPQNVVFPSHSLSEWSRIQSRSISVISENRSVRNNDHKDIELHNGIDSRMGDYNVIEFKDRIISSINSVQRRIKQLSVGPVKEEELENPQTFVSSD